ncbi:MAG: chemotaxis protein CheW [Sphingomonadales bacterium]
MTTTKTGHGRGSAVQAIERSDYVTISLNNQLLGIPVLSVHDVLSAQKITPVPRAPAAIAGVLNLRGRIVTAIDLRTRLHLPPRADGERSMSVVVEHRGESYSLLIDAVGEVLSLPVGQMERNPVTLDTCWQDVSAGIYRLDGELLVILDVGRLLDFGISAAA